MPTIVQVRRDTAANWISANPVLAAGEWARETDTGKLKIGDGITPWTGLSYTIEFAFTESDKTALASLRKVAVTAPDSDPASVALRLPPATARGNSLLGFDATGGVTTTSVASPADLDLVTTKGLRTVATIADLRAMSGRAPGSAIYLQGCNQSGDGGEGVFRWDATSIAADNGGTILTGSTPMGRWVRDFTGEVQATWFGGKTGSAVAAALAASPRVYLPDGDYTVDAMITTGGSKVLRGPGRLVASGATSILTVGNDDLVDGVQFLHTGTGDCIKGPGTASRITIRNCSFTISGGWAIKGYTNWSYCRFIGNRIKGNKTANSAGISLSSAYCCEIAHNYIEGTEHGIFLTRGAKGVVISNNQVFDSTKVGILFFTDRPANATNPGLYVFADNLIVGNLVERSLEEGISLDEGSADTGRPGHPTYPNVACSGTVAAGVAARTWRVSLTPGGQPAAWGNGYYACFLNGAARGHIAEIIDSGDGWIEVERAPGSLVGKISYGNQIAVCVPFFRNKIIGNTVRQEPAPGIGATTCINLWGSCYHCDIENNTAIVKLPATNPPGSLVPIRLVGCIYPAYGGFNSARNNSVSISGQGLDDSATWVRAIDCLPYIKSGLAWSIPAADINPLCEISGNRVSSGFIYVESSAQVRVQGNIVSVAGRGIELNGCINAEIGDNRNTAGQFVTPTQITGTVNQTKTGNTGLRYVTPLVGAGNPEGAINAPVGALYLRTDGGSSTTLYVKETGTGSTGWCAK